MICPPCAEAADYEAQAASVPTNAWMDFGGHWPEICRDPDTCSCAHGPSGTSPREDTS